MRTFRAAIQHCMQPGAEIENPLCENALKRALTRHLEANGWFVEAVAPDNIRGADITAHRDDQKWIIEVKSCGRRPQMRMNYFLAVLGALLQRMSKDAVKYSIALPKLPPFERLWKALPELAKQRTGITALFVDENGSVIEKA